jgi:hypothetical protein
MPKYSVFLGDVPSVNHMYFDMALPLKKPMGKRKFTVIKIPTTELKDFAGYWTNPKDKTGFIPGTASKAFEAAGIPKNLPMDEEGTVIELVAYWPTMLRRDMPNYHKAIGDAMVNAGLFQDDWPLMFRDIKFYYPNHVDRKLEKNVQGFMVTICVRDN